MVSVEELSADNFLSVVDVSEDIKDAMEMTLPNQNSVYIPLLQHRVKFQILFPEDSIGTRDHYCEMRWNAVKYLKDNGYIKELKHINSLHRWDDKIQVFFKAKTFLSFYSHLIDIYTKRVVEPKERRDAIESLAQRKEKNSLQQFSSDKQSDTQKDDTSSKLKETVIKHVHIHIFKNSIQEKEIAISLDDKRNIDKTKNKFPYTIPAGTEWRQISMKVSSGELVHIKLPSKECTATYEEMGLGKHNGKPSVLWDFFKVLASQNGEISIKDDTAKTQYKKQKQQVSDILKNYFSMESDPFYPYKENNSYKTRFTLFSDTVTEKNSRIYDDDKKIRHDRSEIADYMNEIAPTI